MKFLSHWQSICYNFKPISRLSLINKTSHIMDIDYQVGEVELSYKSTVREKRKIATSSDAYGMLLSTFREDTIGYKEYFRFLSVWLNQLRNKLLTNYLRNRGNDLATVRISAFCVAMLSNNSFIYKYNIFFRKYELSTVIFTSIIKKLFRFFSMSY